MTDLEKRRSDVAFWANKLRRDNSDYAQRRWIKAKDKLRLAEIDAENKKLKIF